MEKVTDKKHRNTVSSKTKPKKIVHKLQQRVEKSLLDFATSFLEQRRGQKGLWTQLAGHFFVSQIFE